MYKDGMSISEVTCYPSTRATYNCSRPVIHRHVHTSASYRHGYRYGDTRSGYTDPNTQTYAYDYSYANTDCYTGSQEAIYGVRGRHMVCAR